MHEDGGLVSHLNTAVRCFLIPQPGPCLIDWRPGRVWRRACRLLAQAGVKRTGLPLGAPRLYQSSQEREVKSFSTAPPASLLPLSPSPPCGAEPSFSGADARRDPRGIGSVAEGSVSLPREPRHAALRCRSAAMPLCCDAALQRSILQGERCAALRCALQSVCDGVRLQLSVSAKPAGHLLSFSSDLPVTSENEMSLKCFWEHCYWTDSWQRLFLYFHAIC